MIELLYNTYSKGIMEPSGNFSVENGVVYEHIKISPGVLEVQGEHIMANAGPLRFKKDFFGADETLTNFSPGRTEWVATLINKGGCLKEAWEKRCDVINDILKYFALNKYFDRGGTIMPFMRKDYSNDTFI